MAKAETVQTATLGKKALRLVKKDGRFFGMADGAVCTEGDNADDVWRRLHDDAGKGSPKYFGYAGARIRFLKFFPQGFTSSSFDGHERRYKEAARAKLAQGAPLEEAAAGSGFGEAILSVYRATNLLTPYEKTWVGEVLRGPRSDDFIRAAARFTLEGGKQQLHNMKDALGAKASKWTVATYLPFFWRPEAHMFLKPEVTRDFAERVGHRFHEEYEAALNFPVYESLVNLTERTEQELTALSPRDRIDVQSFIWVVGSYSATDETPAT